MKTTKRIKHLPMAIALVLLALLLLSGVLPHIPRFTASAATPPSLKISIGTPYYYAVAKSNPASVSYGTSGTDSKISASLSGKTITIRESENNKLYELGYVPIITSLQVPAETTLYITLTFTMKGEKNGKGSATETMELFDFGSSDRSSSLTFKTESDSSSYTKKKVYNTGSSMRDSYTVTVAYQNTATTEKTIYRYFGFLAGVHYGSSKAHRLKATCQITSNTATTHTVTPEIHFDKSEAMSSITKNDQTGVTSYPQTNFFPDIDWDLLTSAQQQQIRSLANDGWNPRLSVSQPETNQLRIRSNETPVTTARSRLAYSPFTVPLTVPAHTSRTFYLTFAISYTRNSGSEAGFMAELIEGDVPSSFNIATNAGMKGNTKLRVYSETKGADTVHSGTVTLVVSLTNDTDSTQTYEKNYVFFAGYRKVGVYTPNPNFLLTLENVSYSLYDDTYTVTTDATGCTITTSASTVTGFTPVTATVTALQNYSRPSSVTVMVEGKTLATSKYTYNRTTGKITIPKDYVKGAIKITARGVPDQYSITYTGLTGASLSTRPTTHTYGTATKIGVPTKTGYTFAGWKVNGGSSLYKNLTLGATAYTANITLEATWTNAKYNITYTGLTGASLSTKPTTHTYGTATKIGNPTKTGYAFAGWKINGGSTLYKNLSLGATAYTANITLEATWTPYHKICIGSSCTDASHSNVTWTDWNGTDTIPYTNGVAYVHLSANATRTGRITIKSDQTLYLCLNGKSLSCSDDKYTFEVLGKLVLCDCSAGQTGKAVNTHDAGVTVRNDGVFTLYSGTVENTGAVLNESSYPSGLYNSDTATICGGTIHCVNGYGIVNAVFGGGAESFVMTGGTVKSEAKTAIFMSTGIFTMTGGTVSGESYGIYTQNKNSILYISGGTVNGGTYGIYNYWLGTTIYLSGAPSISGDTAGIYTNDAYCNLYAHNGASTPTPYSGGSILLMYRYIYTSQILVYGVTDENKGAFRYFRTDFKLVQEGDNLVLRSVDDYLITFDPNGGTVEPGSRYLRYNLSYTASGALPTPTRDGYIFDGWYTSATGGNLVDGTITVTTAADHTLYAHWTPEKVISVAITWGAMEFTYSEGDWDPETHTYQNGGWTPNETDGNRITVENNGNVSVDILLTYTQANNEVHGAFQAGSTAAETSFVLEAGNTEQIWLNLSGQPSTTLNGAVLGTVTVKIGGESTS